MEIGRFFKCMCHFVKCRFIEMFTDNLQAESASPFANPHGIEMAGIPARLTGTVNTSFAYNANGSLFVSPIL